MRTFYLKFNPIIAVLRFIWLLATGGLLVRIIYVCYNNFAEDRAKAMLTFIIGVPIAAYFFYVTLKGVLNNTKKYLITDEHISITDFVRFSVEKVGIENVKGFSESKIEYKIGVFKQLIIYLKDGRKFEIMQYEQFNFKSIKPKMIDLGYHYLGFEPYQWKFIDSRVYYFD